jgi:glycogen synthase
MPSRYEPCGLGQLIARVTAASRWCAYRRPRRYRNDPAEGAAANGFTFGEPSPLSLLIALDRSSYWQPQPWLAMVSAGCSRISWDRSAQHYLELYRQAKEAKNV